MTTTVALNKCAANYAPLSPLNFLVHAATVYGDQLAIIYGHTRRTWHETYQRACRLASAIAQAGIERGSTVAVLLPNIPEMVEVHFGVPMAGAVLNTLNTRLDAASLLYMLRHGNAKMLIVDTEFSEVVRHVVQEHPELPLIKVTDRIPADPRIFFGAIEYEQFLANATHEPQWALPDDEWDAIALNYTSGTTSQPKGVVYHHRGAYLAALGNLLEWSMPLHPVYLWTLPMFHCNGWCFPWAIAARAGVNVCMRKFDVNTVFELIRHERVTHYCAAPIVQQSLADASPALREGINHHVHTLVAGAAPSPALLTKIEKMGFQALHVYGLTEVYGPATACAPQRRWHSLPNDERARLSAQQGACHHMQAEVSVRHPDTLLPVPADGKTLGEIMVRGNLCMKGYLNDPASTEEAFRGGWFHTGDLGVITDDDYIQLKDRRKDIIISGGENISSIEIENTLYQHPAVAVAAVIAQPDALWGEVPCAFIELRDGVQASAEDLVIHCRQRLAAYKIPKAVHFGELPKTATGKVMKSVLRSRLQQDKGSNGSA
ncbi:AMP-binding protein [Candidatus Symbiopectobacterium sp. NZEC135]|uniref:AMP-binding protein n=1 Tax=Candidatus Symbiopectobacterium sp. NZEC135 TaxID=2820471 RepID=UPI0022275E0E|nr:AMP-binding protein [Candidatus Symbiopectobacterium sp. NZEC135]MCW2479096.1 AMP-binding protein [Candidatus Symbiopectobacterium sp. NZEC135]